MARHIKQLQCSRILERHTALGRTQVALSRHDINEGLLGVELIVAADDGTFTRSWIGGLWENKDRRKAQRRLMDFFAGVVAAQRALGLVVDRQFA